MQVKTLARAAVILFAAHVAVAERGLFAGGVQSAQPAFRSGVDVIEVAVVVRDDAGGPVRDLRADEVTVLENGVRQQIVALHLVSVPVERRAIAAVSAGPSAPRDVASNEDLAGARVFALVLDALHIAPARLPSVKRLAREFIEKHVGPTDLVAVFSPGASPDATEDFTTDKQRLVAAVDQFTATKLRSATIERLEEERWADLTNVRIHDGKDPSDSERAARVRSLAGVLQALAGHLDRIEGRRAALLLFSEGVDYDVGDMMGEAQREASGVVHALRQAVGALMRSNVALYSIDPRALSTSAGEMLEDPVHRPFEKPGDTISQFGLEEERAASVRSLRDLAESTGGFAAVTSNDAAGAFDRIMNESSEYYMVGYTPAKAAKPGESRSISVQVARPNVRVVARSGYVVPKAVRAGPVGTGESETSGFAAAVQGRSRSRNATDLRSSTTASPSSGAPASELTRLLASPLPKSGLPIRVQAIPKTGDKKRVVRLVVEVLGAGLDFVERNGRSEERIELALVTVDSNGKAANGRSTTIDLRLRPDELQRARATGARWVSQLELAPGRYQLRVAGRAVRTGSSGLVTHAVNVPPFERGRLSMSGVTISSTTAPLMLMKREGRSEEDVGSAPPSAARRFVAGDDITAALELYLPPGMSADPQVVAELRGPAGRPVVSAMGHVRTASSDSRTRHVLFEIATARLTPGLYVLRIAAGASNGEQRLERAVPFEVLPLAKR